LIEDFFLVNLSTLLMIAGVLFLTSMFKTLFVPRLELAKGTRGNIGGIRALMYRWALETLWRQMPFPPFSIWTVILAGQTLFVSILLYPAFKLSSFSNYELALPVTFLTLHLLTLFHPYRQESFKSLKLRETAQGLMSATFIMVLCLLTQQESFTSIGHNLLYILSRILGAYVYILCLPLFVDRKEDGVPAVVARFSVFGALAFFVVAFLPVHANEPVFQIFEFAIKLSIVLFVYDVWNALTSNVKRKTREERAVRTGFPLLYLWSLIVIWSMR
jgi:hypothetical protein